MHMPEENIIIDHSLHSLFGAGFGGAPNLVPVQCFKVHVQVSLPGFYKGERGSKKYLDINTVHRCEIRPGVKHIC